MKNTELSEERRQQALLCGISRVVAASSSMLILLSLTQLLIDVGKQVAVNALRCGSERTVPLTWSWMESSRAGSEAGRITHSLQRCVADEALCLCSVRRVLWRFLLSRHDIRHNYLSYEAKLCTFTSFKAEIQHSQTKCDLIVFWESKVKASGTSRL